MRVGFAGSRRMERLGWLPKARTSTGTVGCGDKQPVDLSTVTTNRAPSSDLTISEGQREAGRGSRLLQAKGSQQYEGRVIAVERPSICDKWVPLTRL